MQSDGIIAPLGWATAELMVDGVTVFYGDKKVLRSVDADIVSQVREALESDTTLVWK